MTHELVQFVDETNLTQNLFLLLLTTAAAVFHFRLFHSFLYTAYGCSQFCRIVFMYFLFLFRLFSTNHANSVKCESLNIPTVLGVAALCE